MYGNVFKPVQGLSEASRIYPGGLCEVLFTPWENVLTWPAIDPLTGGVSDEIELRPSTVLYTAELNQQTKIFGEETQEASPGHFHAMEVAATLPGNVPENVLILSSMKFHRFLVIFKSKNGDFRFLGNEDSGAKLSYRYTDGDGGKSRNRELKFNWSHQNAAPIYLGTLTEIPITIASGGNFMFIEAFKVKAGEAIEPGGSTYTNALIENKKVFVIINEQKILSTDVNDMDGDRYIAKSLLSDSFTIRDMNGDPIALNENDNVEIYAHD